MVEKVEKSKCNNKKIANKVDRNFDDRPSLEACVSDLTYVRVGNNWNYICAIIDLHNREIIGYAAGKNKSADLVKEAIYSIKYPLNKIKIFHTDRGREFYNKSVDKSPDILYIERSLSEKGSSYDSAFNKVMKTEFIYQNEFEKLNQLKLSLLEYIYWYNNLRIHGFLGYVTPLEYRQLRLASKY